MDMELMPNLHLYGPGLKVPNKNVRLPIARSAKPMTIKTPALSPPPSVFVARFVR